MLKIMIKYLIIILFVVFVPNFKAQSIITISPGIKLGYAFGNEGGFVFGLEGSIMVDQNNHNPNRYRYGLVVSIETINDERRIHVGGQVNFSGGYSLFGVEVGPTFLIEESKRAVGLSITPYLGGFIIPYFRVNVFPQKDIQTEIGTFLKLHLPVQGQYSLG